jgi:hypothetical protein
MVTYLHMGAMLVALTFFAMRPGAGLAADWSIITASTAAECG